MAVYEHFYSRLVLPKDFRFYINFATFLGHSALKRWTRKVDIFSFDLILIPVHLGMHWCLATIDLKRKGVFYYDSMGGDNTECLDALLQYLQVSYLDIIKDKILSIDDAIWVFESHTLLYSR